MMTATALDRRNAFAVRDARPSDNDALCDIAARCPMRGDISLRITREPDFFALGRVEGAVTRLGVVEASGKVAGCVMVTKRESYINGVMRPSLYSGDLKVHPTWRGWGVADALSEWVVQAGAEMAGRDAPLVITVLAGNRAMEQRLAGTAGVPELRAFARLRAFSVPLLWRRRPPRDRAFRVDRASLGDIEEMAALWARIAPERQFAEHLSAGTLAAWIGRAPGLDISDYRVARDRTGRIVAFLGWWNQTSFKQTRVMSYSRRLGVARTAINAVAAVTRSAPLPPPGGSLTHRTAVHVCAASGSRAALRALVLSAFGDVRDEGCAFINIGLDARDPLIASLAGLFAQPTDIGAYVCTPGGPCDVATLSGRPLHHEIALV